MKSITVTQNDKDILKLVCEQAPEGVTIEQVRSAIRVLDVIDAAGDVLALEDADHHFLQRKFSNTKFIKADRGILDLYDRVVSAS